MELDEYLLALRKRWLVIGVLGIIGGLLGYGYAQSITPAFKATANVFVSVNQGDTAGDLVQGSTFVQNSIASFGKLASMPVVLDPVIADLDLDVSAKALGRQVSADNPLNTFILAISTTDANPQLAADVSNAVALQLTKTVQDLSPRTAKGASAIDLTVVAPAATPKVPFKPNTKFLTATGLALGLAAGVAFALLLTVLDKRVRTTGDLERISDVPLLGSITRSRSSSLAYTTLLNAPTTPRAEGFRRLQANLQYLETGASLNSIVVTSAVPAEGKTSTTLNLALAVAEKGGSVLVIDADLRRPAIGSSAGIESAVGLTTVLIGHASLEDVVQTWGNDNLHLLPSGALPPNPSQLLDSPAMHSLLDEAVKLYDLVVIDCPPVLPVIDAPVLGRHADGVLMVVALRRTRKHQLRSALASLDTVGASVLGVVATNVVDKGMDGTYGYSYQPVKKKRWSRRRKSTGAPHHVAQPPTAPAEKVEHVADTRADEQPQAPVAETVDTTSAAAETIDEVSRPTSVDGDDDTDDDGADDAGPDDDGAHDLDPDLTTASSSSKDVPAPRAST
ncbi:polysaccharide biosynthesis tyrosine autokinase [Cellulomonas rhizosphaerae]|uniref:polysaccharide biosynthesis tyrosine autokinase n=1 Tax=Cellulomonas rhizosphaerae TaxID=2293719 RepID=UPI001314C484|nr:polysaccharide biosynthesis tyrosine autokinase [Cellulomonas rhizosphaerae]